VDGTDLTFYAGLFDQDKTLIDVKALVWDETKKDYSPVTFTNLQKGTYLVFETDEEGVPVKEDEDYQISYLVESVFDNQNISTPKKGKVSVVLDNEVPQSQITIINKVRMEGEILIEKTIDLGEYTTSDYPTFIFKLTYLGIDGTEENGCTYYRSISFTGEENVGTAVFEKLPFGYYQLEELNSMRYEFKGLELKNAVEAEGEVTGHTALIQLTGKSATITASYLNEKNNDHNFSDSDIVTNYFKKTVDENGNVTSEGFKVDVVR